MRKPIRRRSPLATVYWILSSLALAALTAWQFDWIPTDFVVNPSTSPSGEQLVDMQESEKAGRHPFDEMKEDSEIFNNQTEPPVQGESFEDTRFLSQASRTPPQRLDPQYTGEPRSTSNMAGEFTTTTAEQWSAQKELPPRQQTATIVKDSVGILQPQDHDDRLIGRAEQRSIRQVSNEVEQPPRAVTATHPELPEIDVQIESGNYLDAHRALSKLYWNQPELHPLIAERIDHTAKSIYFSPQPHYMEAYVVQSGDLLQRISHRYNVSWQYLARLNQIDPLKIRPGQKLKVIKGPFSAVVDLSDFELTIHAHGYYVRRYPVGIGRDGASPIGKFAVLEKIANPQYTDPEGRVVDADDPGNPLGERWIDLGDSYGIHGTIDPNSIGRAESRGCIRLHNADVEQVYDLLTKGSEVIIRR